MKTIPEILKEAENFCINKDYKNAILSYQEASKLGSDEAYLNLGSVYFVKYSAMLFNVELNRELGWQYLNKAAELGNSTAMMLIGQSFQKGDYVPKDLFEAYYWLDKSSSKGNLTAKFILMIYLIDELKDSKLYHKAFEAASQLIDTEYNNFAKYYLLICYLNGYGTSVNFTKAEELYDEIKDLSLGFDLKEIEYKILENKADNDDTQAMIRMAQKAVSNSDYNKAYYWYDRAAKLGEEIAMSIIVNICDKSYAQYQDIPEEPERAFEYAKILSKNDSYYLYKLSQYYQKGYGTAANEQLSQECYQKYLIMSSKERGYR